MRFNYTFNYSQKFEFLLGVDIRLLFHRRAHFALKTLLFRLEVMGEAANKLQ